ncbi:cyclic nucleotide-binding domain-containing protein [Mariprofundus ferrinatatus]|nr:cyclic nucleotide-binding domain-containing protein [Mariprofundus ferrinatatus]
MAEITQAGGEETGGERAKLFELINQLSDSEALNFISQANLIRVNIGDNIVTQGEASETFYLILEGDVDVQLELKNGGTTTLKTLGPGDFFGEFACVYKLKRSATVTAKTQTILLEFSAQSVLQLMKEFPIAGEYLIQTVQTRMVHATTHFMPAFSELPEEDKQWLVEESEVNEYAGGVEVPASALLDSACHVIISGTAEVYMSNGKTLSLSTGDMFGSISPYIEIPADAVIRTRDRLLICEVPEKIFRTFMNLYASFEKQVKHEGEKRKAL